MSKIIYYLVCKIIKFRNRLKLIPKNILDIYKTYRHNTSTRTFKLSNTAYHNQYVTGVSMPQFKGTDLGQYIIDNLNYPLNLQQKGRIQVSFDINESGEVVNPTIVKSLSPESDSAAIAVFESMPNWMPATKDGKPITVNHTITIRFE